MRVEAIAALLELLDLLDGEAISTETKRMR